MTHTVDGYTIEEVINFAGGEWHNNPYDWYPSGWYNSPTEIRVRYVDGGSDLICSKEEFLNKKFNEKKL